MQNQNVNPENAVLGAILLKPDSLEKILFLRPKHFQSERNAKIYDAIQFLKINNTPIDLLTLVNHLRTKNILEDVGGAAYISGLTNSVPSSANIVYYAKAVKESADARAVLELAGKIPGILDNKSMSFEEKLASIRTGLGDCTEDETAPKKRALTFTPIGEIETLPTDWLVDRLIPTASSGRIVGDTGTLKSFWAIDLAASIATGTPFHGHKTKVAPVFYIAGEGQGGLKKRFVAWCIRNGVDIKTMPVYIASNAVDMIDKASVNEIIAKINQMVSQVGNPGMVILDTLARNFGPGDENTSKDMGAYVAGCDRIRDMYQCTVLTVHHTGIMDKGRGRGSSASKAAMDFEFLFDLDIDGILRVTSTKSKDSAPPMPMAFTARSVEIGIFDTEGREETSLVLDEIEYTVRETGRKGASQKETVLQVLVTECDNLDKMETGILEVDWRKRCYECGISKSSYYRAKKELFANSEIVYEVGHVRPSG